MIDISNKEAALLGLVAEKPKHAYEIMQDIESRSMDYWTEISMSSVYKLLVKLEERKLVKSKTKMSEKNVVQKVYSLTRLGSNVLKTKIKEFASMWLPSIHPIDVALRNLNLLDHQEVLECLERYRESLDDTMHEYRELENFIIEKGGHLANIQLATRRIFMLEGEKKWLEKFIDDFLHAESNNLNIIKVEKE